MRGGDLQLYGGNFYGDFALRGPRIATRGLVKLYQPLWGMSLEHLVVYDWEAKLSNPRTVYLRTFFKDPSLFHTYKSANVIFSFYVCTT